MKNVRSHAIVTFLVEMQSFQNHMDIGIQLHAGVTKDFWMTLIGNIIGDKCQRVYQLHYSC